MVPKDGYRDKCRQLIPKEKQDVMREIGIAASNAGERCYAVGGAARDCATGIVPKDVDIVCSDAEKVIIAIQHRRKQRGEEPVKVSPLTNQLTRVVTIGKEQLDFAQARMESYAGMGKSIKPGEVRRASVEEDAMRRDFTINTLLLDLSDDHFLDIIDVTGRGIRDLENRVLDTPSDPDETFKDDPSRLLRLARFSTCKGFKPLDRVVRSARENAREIARVPWEKFNEELTRGSPCPKYFQSLDDLGLLEQIVPEVTAGKGIKQPQKHHSHDVFSHTMIVVENAPPHLKFVALLHDVGKVPLLVAEGHSKGHEKISAEMAREAMRRLKFPNAEVDRVVQLVARHMEANALVNDMQANTLTDRAVRRFVNRNFDILDDLRAFAVADSIGTGKDIDEKVRGVEQFYAKVAELRAAGTTKVEKIAVTGKDIMDVLGMPPGKEIGRVLGELRQKVVDGDLPDDRATLLNEIKKLRT